MKHRRAFVMMIAVVIPTTIIITLVSERYGCTYFWPDSYRCDDASPNAPVASEERS
ncbi:hypothetical protein [Roseovarius dicentrarchi]|uniref:hypothetical protein n=1 Tax=Roseovarius dicentrarchi TaxID=2250573 RepID=UPI00193993D5|nr:hypothetical protein [Roseovarius dicentrarchi]